MLKIVKSKTNLLPFYSKTNKTIYNNTVGTLQEETISKYNIVAFKTDYKNISRIKSDEEYKRIRLEGGFSLSEEDMRWIDENLYERYSDQTLSG